MPSMMLDWNGFLAEATALSRPGLQLRAQGAGEPDAYWHGDLHGGPVASVRREDGWINVHTGPGGPWAEQSDGPLISAVALFAHPARSLPPVTVVFMRGSAAIEAHLAEHGLRRDWPDHPSPKDAVARAYERHWQATCPMYSAGTHAVSGGWPVPWPDGDYLEWIDAELLLWTLQDAEPWVEAYRRHGKLHVLSRIT
jgi:hypothetical protein